MIDEEQVKKMIDEALQMPIVDDKGEITGHLPLIQVVSQMSKATVKLVQDVDDIKKPKIIV